jgi:hypothetical protein
MSARQDPVVCSRTGRYRFAARLVALTFWRTVAEVSKQMLEDLVKPVYGRDAGMAAEENHCVRCAF